MNLNALPHGLAALPGHAVLLDEKGLSLFADRQGAVTFVGRYNLPDALSWSLSARGTWSA